MAAEKSTSSAFVTPIARLLMAAALALALSACSAHVPADQAAEDVESEHISQADGADAAADAEPDAAGEADDGADGSSEDAADAAEAGLGDLVETQRVGSIEYGFINVPADYVEFTDLEGGDDLQYSDMAGTSIFTLNAFDMETVPEEMLETFDARAAAEAVWHNIEEDGAQDVAGAIVTIADVEAYQVWGTYEDGIYLVCWLISAPDGSIRYLAVEGPEQTIADNVALAEASYGFTR